MSSQWNSWFGNVANLRDRVQNLIGNYTELQKRVRDLTNNDAWGASPTEMHSLCHVIDNEGYTQVMQVLRDRWTNSLSTWRNLYKSLTLYEYFLLHSLHLAGGGEQSDERIISTLAEYEYRDSQGKDQGINVSTRARAILQLMRNGEVRQEARTKAAENRKIMMCRRGGATASTSGADENLLSGLETQTPFGSSTVQSPCERPPEKASQKNIVLSNPMNGPRIIQSQKFENSADEFDDYQSAPATEATDLGYHASIGSKDNILIDL